MTVGAHLDSINIVSMHLPHDLPQHRYFLPDCQTYCIDGAHIHGYAKCIKSGDTMSRHIADISRSSRSTRSPSDEPEHGIPITAVVNENCKSAFASKW
jgi:hypothetical protein